MEARYVEGDDARCCTTTTRIVPRGMRYSLNRYAVHRVVLKIASSMTKRGGRGVEEGERMRNNVQWKFFTHAPPYLGTLIVVVGK